MIRGCGGIGAVLRLATLGVCLVAAACSQAAPPLEGALDAGTFQGTLALSLPPDSGLTAVSYKILSGTGATLASGVFAIDESNPTASLMLALPLGSGEVIELQGITSGGAPCHGTSAPFNVVESQAVNLGVTLVCRTTDADAATD